MPSASFNMMETSAARTELAAGGATEKRTTERPALPSSGPDCFTVHEERRLQLEVRRGRSVELHCKHDAVPGRYSRRGREQRRSGLAHGLRRVLSPSL